MLNLLDATLNSQQRNERQEDVSQKVEGLNPSTDLCEQNLC